MVRTLLGSLCALLVSTSAAQGSWTAPTLLNACPPAVASTTVASTTASATAATTAPGKPPAAVAQLASGMPLIVYPSSEPQVRSGAGMLLWNAAGRCARGAPEVFGAPLQAGGLPGTGRALNGPPGSARSSAGGSGPAGGGPRPAGGGSGPAGSGSNSAGSGAGPTGGAGSAGGGGGPAGGLASVSAAVGTAEGQVIALGRTIAGSGALAEGGLSGAFAAARSLGGPAEPVAAASGYLGDAVVVSLERSPPRARARALTQPARAGGKTTSPRARTRAAGSANDMPIPAPWTLAVRIQRHYSSSPQSALAVPVGGAAPVALAVAMDFRSDLLLVWAAQGAIRARELTQSGAAGPVRRLAGVAGVPELRALFSDDGRAIVVWREQRASTTSIYVDISDALLRFAAPRTVERYADPPRLVPPSGSLRLVRLSSEAVMMAWTGLRAGRYVVRASPVSLRRGVWAPVVISGAPAARAAAGSSGGGSSGLAGSSGGGSSGTRPAEALLAGLVPGPDAEVLALWTAAPLTASGRLDPRRRAIVAAWGHYGGRGEARFAPPEAVSPPGPNGPPAAAFDPQNDRALAAWVTGTSSPRVAFAQRSPGPPAASTGPPTASAAAMSPYRPLSAVRRARGSGAGGSGTRPVWLSALGLLMLAVAGAVRQLSARRRGIRGPRGPARWEGRVRVPREPTRRAPWRRR